MPRAYIRPRRGTTNTMQGKAKDMILLEGEVFFEYPDKDDKYGIGAIKLGDGKTTYENLPYFINPREDVLKVLMIREEGNCNSLKELILKEDLKRSKISTFKEKVKIATCFVVMICMLFLAYLGVMQAPKDENGHLINTYELEENLTE